MNKVESSQFSFFLLLLLFKFQFMNKWYLLQFSTSYLIQTQIVEILCWFIYFFLLEKQPNSCFSFLINLISNHFENFLLFCSSSSVLNSLTNTLVNIWKKRRRRWMFGVVVDIKHIQKWERAQQQAHIREKKEHVSV